MNDEPDLVFSRRRRRLRIALLAAGLVIVGVLVGTIAVVLWREHERMRSRSVLIAGGQGVLSIDFNGRGDLMAITHGWSASLVGAVPGPIRIVRRESGSLVGELAGSGGGKLTGESAISDDGELMAYGTCSFNSGRHRFCGDAIVLCSLRDARCLSKLAVESLLGIAFSPDGHELIDASGRDKIEYRDIATGSVKREVMVPGCIRLRRAGPEFLLVDIAQEDSTGQHRRLELRSLSTGAVVVPSLDEPADLDVNLTVPNQSILITKGEREKTLVIRSLPSGAIFRKLSVGYEYAMSVAISDEADLIAVLSYDGADGTCVDLFSVDGGGILQTWRFGRLEAQVVAFVPGADTLAIGTNDGRVELRPFRR